MIHWAMCVRQKAHPYLFQGHILTSLLAANLPDNKLSQTVNQKSFHPQDHHSFTATQVFFASCLEGKDHLLLD